MGCHALWAAHFSFQGSHLEKTKKNRGISYETPRFSHILINIISIVVFSYDTGNFVWCHTAIDFFAYHQNWGETAGADAAETVQ